MDETPTFSQRLRYAFDNVMGRGPIALIGLLLVLTLALVLFIATVLVVGGVAPGDAREPLDFIEAFWLAVVRTLDPGTFGADTGWRFRLIMLIDTLGGIFIVAALIGILSAGLEDRLGEMRKGRSLVVEEGHTLILGWSPKIFTIIRELALANDSARKPRVVIVSSRDKVEMDDAIRERVPNIGRMKVICRTGSPIDPSEIQVGRPLAAKSIIVLAPEAEDPDAQVIKTIFALTGQISAENERHRLRIVAEIHEERSLRTVQIIGRGQVQSVLLGDIITRIAAQTCRQSGLSVVMTELLGFNGNEFYVYENATLAGMTFREAGRMFDTCVLCGILPQIGELRLNPLPDARFEQGDRAIVIALDDSLIRMKAATGAIDESDICAPSPPVRSPERTLILGWSKRGPRLINELDTYSTPNSIVHVVTEDVRAAAAITRVRGSFIHSTVTVHADDTTDRQALDALDIPAYHHVIVLCADDIPLQRADARAMITLAHLRDIVEKSGATTSITAEMLDVRDRDLVRVNRPDDFVVSDELTSLMVVQLSESRELAPVFQELFTVEGCEVYLKPATDYVTKGVPTTFDTLAEAASRRHEVALGYRLAAHAGDSSQRYGVVINPRKTEKITFSQGDRVIVLSEN